MSNPITVIFNDDSISVLPIYAMYSEQYKPQDAFVTLDLENGEVDADYDQIIGNGMPLSVWNNVVIRFPIDPCLTSDSICNVIDTYKVELQSLYNESIVEFDFNSNLCGNPNNGDKKTWLNTIRELSETIENYSHDLAVNVADYDTVDSVIEVTPPTSNLRDYAISVLSNIKSECFVPDYLDDVDVISRMIMSDLATNTDCLNKNGLEMLLNNIDEYKNEIGVCRADVDEDDIEAALERI